MPTGLEVLRHTVKRYIKAKENALKECTEGCSSVCRDCIFKNVEALRALEVSQFPSQEDVA